MKVKPLADGRVPTPILFDSIDPDDIEQGTLGDCWFLSGMSGRQPPSHPTPCVVLGDGFLGVCSSASA